MDGFEKLLDFVRLRKWSDEARAASLEARRGGEGKKEAGEVKEPGEKAVAEVRSRDKRYDREMEKNNQKHDSAYARVAAEKGLNSPEIKHLRAEFLRLRGEFQDHASRLVGAYRAGKRSGVAKEETHEGSERHLKAAKAYEALDWRVVKETGESLVYHLGREQK